MRKQSLTLMVIGTLTLLGAARGVQAQDRAPVASASDVAPTSASPAPHCDGTTPCAPAFAATVGLALGGGDSHSRAVFLQTAGVSVCVYGPLSLTLRGGFEERPLMQMFAAGDSTLSWRVGAGGSYALTSSGRFVARAGVVAGRSTITTYEGGLDLDLFYDDGPNPPVVREESLLRGTAGLGVAFYFGNVALGLYVDGEVGADQASVLFGVELGAMVR